MGVTSSYARVRLPDLAKGRFVSDRDDLVAAKVAVLGATVEQYLFQDQDLIGKRILISGVDFEVVSVLTSRGDGPGLGPGMSTDDRVCAWPGVQYRTDWVNFHLGRSPSEILRLRFAMGKIRGTPCMRSHISVHRATTKYFSNPFVFKTPIEKEGLPSDSPAALGAGGLEFKPPRPDQNISRVFFSLLKAFFTQNPPVEIRQTGGLDPQVV